MGNYYCKKCGVPKSYYSEKYERKSCRELLIDTDGKNTSYHEWKFYFNCQK